MARFRVLITVTVEIDVADSILALSQDQDWVSSFYGLSNPEQIASHLAWNCGLHERALSRLDGFADRADADVIAEVIDVEYETERID